MTEKEHAFKQYFTPTNIAELLVKHIQRQKVENIIDLAAGDGELLLAASRKFKKAKLYGADIDNKVIEKIKKENKIKDVELWIGDSLDTKIDKWIEYKNMVDSGGFDVVISNPPFDYFTKKDINGKKYSIEVAFLLKAIEVVKDNGIIAIILPNGLFTNPNSHSIREIIFRSTKVKKIIQLYKNSFKNVKTDISMIIMQKKQSTRVQKNINLIKIDEEFNERHISITGKEGVERLDFDYYDNIKEIIKSINQIKFENRTLRELIEYCRRGITITNKKDCISDEGSPFLHTTNVGNIIIDKSNFKYISNSCLEKFSKAKVKLNDVLVGRVGSRCINKISIVSYKEEIGIASDCLFILRSSKINPYYLAIFLKSDLGVQQLQCIKRGSCSKFITKEDLLSIQVPIISDEYQINIEKRIKQYINTIDDKNILNNKIESEIVFLNTLFRKSAI